MSTIKPESPLISSPGGVIFLEYLLSKQLGRLHKTIQDTIQYLESEGLDCQIQLRIAEPPQRITLPKGVDLSHYIDLDDPRSFGGILEYRLLLKRGDTPLSQSALHLGRKDVSYTHGPTDAPPSLPEVVAYASLTNVFKMHHVKYYQHDQMFEHAFKMALDAHRRAVSSSPTNQEAFFTKQLSDYIVGSLQTALKTTDFNALRAVMPILTQPELSFLLEAIFKQSEVGLGQMLDRMVEVEVIDKKVLSDFIERKLPEGHPLLTLKTFLKQRLADLETKCRPTKTLGDKLLRTESTRSSSSSTDQPRFIDSPSVLDSNLTSIGLLSDKMDGPKQ